jgi:chromosome transmission fidelity protein 1
VIFLDALKSYIGDWKDAKAKKQDEKTEVMTVGDLIGRLGKKVAGINLLEIEAYLKRSKVCIIF